MNTIPTPRYTYDAYMGLMEQLVKNKQTTGPDQSTSLISFTALNLVRMQRISHTFHFEDSLAESIVSLQRQYVFVVITEAWCGDAAQILPVIQQIAAANPFHIDLLLVFRDENPDYMARYLSNGTRSIPKLIIYDLAANTEITQWGPRPKALQDYIESLKEAGLKKEAWIEKAMLWYAKDKTKTTQEELAALIDSLEKRL